MAMVDVDNKGDKGRVRMICSGESHTTHVNNSCPVDNLIDCLLITR
jgi:hypothetical protein